MRVLFATFTLLLCVAIANNEGFRVDKSWMLPYCDQPEYEVRALSCVKENCLVGCLFPSGPELKLMVHVPTETTTILTDLNNTACFNSERYIYCVNATRLTVMDGTTVAHSIINPFDWMAGYTVTALPEVVALSTADKEYVFLYFKEVENRFGRMAFDASDVTTELVGDRLNGTIGSNKFPYGGFGLSYLQTPIYDMYACSGETLAHAHVADVKSIIAETNGENLDGHLYSLVLEFTTYGPSVDKDNTMYVAYAGGYPMKLYDLNDPLVLNHGGSVISDYKVLSQFVSVTCGSYIAYGPKGNSLYTTSRTDGFGRLKASRYDFDTELKTDVYGEYPDDKALNQRVVFSSLNPYFSTQGLKFYTIARMYNSTPNKDRTAIFQLDASSCGVYNCSTCPNDPINCDYCVEEAQCQFWNYTCSNKELVLETDALCPKIWDYTPKWVDTTHTWQVNVTLTGQFYSDILISKYFNLTDDALAAAYDNYEAEATNTTLRFWLDELDPDDAEYNFVVQRYHRPYVDGLLQFRAINCSRILYCHACTTGTGGCTWCQETSTCSSGAGCATNTSTCPMTLSVTPTYVPSFNSTPLVLEVSDMYQIATHCAVYNSTDVFFTPATQITATNYTCDSPLLYLGELNVTMSIILSSDPNLGNGGAKYLSSPVPLVFVDCVTATQCSDCLNEYGATYCSWCSVDEACVTLQDKLSCSYAIYQEGHCPYGTLEPSSYLQNNTDVNITIVGGRFDDPSPKNFYVQYVGPYTTSVCTYVNETTLTFVPPNLPAGFWDVVLFFESPGGDDIIYMQDYLGPYEVYNCTTNTTTCSECIDWREDNHGLCGFCFWDSCNVSAACDPQGGSGGALASCPVLTSLSPSYIHASESPQLTVFGNYFYNVSGYSYSCSFAGGLYNTAATFVNDTSLVCGTPPALGGTSGSGYYSVEVLINGGLYSEDSLVLEVYVCSQYGSNCSVCLQNSGFCSFCFYSICTEKADVASVCADTFSVAACPSAGSVLPDSWYTYPNHQDPVNVTVSGNFYLGQYAGTAAGAGLGTQVAVQCYVPESDQWFEAIEYNDTAVVCEAENGINVKVYVAMESLPVHVIVNGSTNLGTADILYYDCSFSRYNDNCTSCLDHPISHCGWCFASDECIQFESCGSSSSFRGSQCLAASGLSTSFADASAPQKVEIQGTGFFDSQFTTCIFRKNATYSLGVLASYVSDTVLECSTPVLEPAAFAAGQLTESYELFLAFIEIPMEPGKLFGFDFLKCENIVNFQDTCITCISPLESRCAWCLDTPSNETTSCVPITSCSSPEVTVSGTSTCPVLSSVLPSQAVFDGPVDVMVNGTRFFNSTKFTCAFGSYHTAATFLSNTSVSCKSPYLPNMDSEILSVTLKLYFDGFDFAPDQQLSFSFVAGSNGNDDTITKILIGLLSGVSVASIVTLLLMALIIIILIIIIVIVAVAARRTRKSSYDIAISPPDFKAVPFVMSNKPKYNVLKDTRRHLMLLENIMLDNDDGILYYLINNLKPEEKDRFAKAIVPLSMCNEEAGDIVSLINTVISMEIESCISENTLFRANSMATKLFGEYSRIIGLNYLWSTLAVPVHLLDKKFDVSSADESSGVEMEPLIVEINPSKMDDKSVDFINANTYELLFHISKIFTRLVRQKHLVPAQIRRILIHAEHSLLDKFPNAIHKGIGALFFLRFVCPALSLPHIYGILQAPPVAPTQRALVLVTKVLQNLANETLPGKKEEYMKKMDTFIEENLEPYHNFLLELINLHTMETSPEVDIPIPKYTRENARVDLMKIIKDHEKDLGTKFAPIENALTNIQDF